MRFPTNYKDIIDRVNKISPKKYCKNRNFIDGDVTYLSPYISRGVISTKLIYEICLNKGYNLNEIEKFVQELAWRDYWQLLWIENDINKDLKHPQPDITNNEISLGIINAESGIDIIDQEIKELYKNGYLHNHLRMYIASICCNISKSNWRNPAKWMYYYLLDGDWASNALSWQWVAGANSNKKYYANQENINKYTYSNQRKTYLDESYEKIVNISIPEKLTERILFNKKTIFPNFDKLLIDKGIETCLYNYYNLDPLWRSKAKANRVLIIEPSIFEKYPISKNCMDFMLALANNIKNIQIFVGEFIDLEKMINQNKINFKEHPLSLHYRGNQESREWLTNVKGSYSSFFKYWNKAKKELKKSI